MVLQSARCILRESNKRAQRPPSQTRHEGPELPGQVPVWTHSLRFLESPGVRRTSHLTPPRNGAGTGAAGPNPILSPATRGLGGPIAPPMSCGDQRGSLVSGRRRAQPRPRPRPPSRLCPRSTRALGFRGPGQPQAAAAHVTLGSPASSPRSSAGTRRPWPAEANGVVTFTET